MATRTQRQQPEIRDEAERGISSPAPASEPEGEQQQPEAERTEQIESEEQEERTLVTQKGATASAFQVGDRVKQSPNGVTYQVGAVFESEDMLRVFTQRGFWTCRAGTFFHEQPKQEEPQPEAQPEEEVSAEDMEHGAEPGSKEDLTAQLENLLQQA